MNSELIKLLLNKLHTYSEFELNLHNSNKDPITLGRHLGAEDCLQIIEEFFKNKMLDK